jgi:hypothetical protein
VLSPKAYEELKKQESGQRPPTAGQINRQTAAIQRAGNSSVQLAAQITALTAQVNQLSAVVSKQTDMSREVGIIGLKVELLEAAKTAAEAREEKNHQDNLGMWRSIGGGVITSILLTGGTLAVVFLRGKLLLSRIASTEERHAAEVGAVAAKVGEVREQVGNMSDRVGIVSDTVDGVRDAVAGTSGDVAALNLKTNGMLERLLAMAGEKGFREGQKEERAHPTAKS